jgi:predicted amidophosphoribosyltransferase
MMIRLTCRYCSIDVEFAGEVCSDCQREQRVDEFNEPEQDS